MIRVALRLLCYAHFLFIKKKKKRIMQKATWYMQLNHGTTYHQLKFLWFWLAWKWIPCSSIDEKDQYLVGFKKLNLSLLSC